MTVYTNINTLIKVQSLMNELDLNGVLNGEGVEIDFIKLLNELLSGGKLVEFLQIITKDETTDFAEMPLTEVKDIIKAFFQDITECLPGAITRAMRVTTGDTNTISS
ncbi:MAG: hypothetical protein WC965_11810 [Thiohalomonadaceae bacterium]